MGTVPKILKKKAKVEAKKEQKKVSKSLLDALKKQGKTSSSTPRSNDKKANEKKAPATFNKSKGPKQPFMSQKFKTSGDQGKRSEDFAGGKSNGAKKFAPVAAKSSGREGTKGTGSGSAGTPVVKDYRSSKPNFQLVENLKPVWNKIRDRTTPKNVRSELVERLVKQMKGKVLQVALRHDASRVVQCIFQYGTVMQRKQILDELALKMVEISKTPYGHFCVLKAIAYCSEDEEKSKIVSSFKGSFRSLCRNVIGARAVESLLQLYSPSLVKDLRAEFYGQKFTVLLKDGSPKSLRVLLEGTPTGKHSAVMDHMRDLVSNFVEKGLLDFVYAHEILWEYVREVGATDKSRALDLVNQLTEAAPKLMSTKPGTRVVCFVASWSGAKERKRLMKSLKGKVLESLLHDSGHLAIMRLIDVTDDTVSVQKMLLDELKDTKPVTKYTADGTLIGTPYPPLVQVAKHRMGCKLLYRLLAPQVHHLEPDEEHLFATAAENSLKAPAMKRSEHLSYLKSPLISVMSRYAKDLLQCRSGSRVLRLVVEVFQPQSLIEAIVAAYSGADFIETDGIENDNFEQEEDQDGEEDEEEEEEAVEVDKTKGKRKRNDETDGGHHHKEGSDWGSDDDIDDDDEKLSLLPSNTKNEKTKQSVLDSTPSVPLHEDPVAHQILKQLLQMEAAAERGAKVDTSLWSGENTSFLPIALPLFNALMENNTLSTWLGCNRGCFSLLAMLEVPSAKKAVLNALGPKGLHSPQLREMAGKLDGAKKLSENTLGGVSLSQAAVKGGKKK